MGWLGPAISGGMHLLSQTLGDWFQQRRMKEAMSSKVLLDMVSNSQGPEQEKMADIAAPKVLGIPQWPRSAPQQTFTPEGGGGQPLNIQQAFQASHESNAAFDVGEQPGKPIGLPAPSTEHQLGQLMAKDPRLLAMAAQQKFGGKPIALHPGGAAFSPVTGEKMFEQPALPQKPVAVRPGGTLVNPGTGQAVYTAPPAPEKPEKLKTTIKEMADPQDPYGPPKLFLVNTQNGDVLKKVGDKGGQLDPAAIEMFAEMGLVDPKALPAMGFGPQMRGPVFSRMGQLAVERGINPPDLATREIVRSSIKTGLAQLEGQAAKIDAFSRTFDKNIQVVRDLLKKNDPRTGVPIFNKWIQAGKRSVTGDPDISALDVGVKTIANEYARISSSATGGGQTSEQEIDKAEKLIAAAQAPDQMEAALGVMEKDKVNRLTSFADTRKAYRDRLDALAKEAKGGGAKAPSKALQNMTTDELKAAIQQKASEGAQQ